MDIIYEWSNIFLKSCKAIINRIKFFGYSFLKTQVILVISKHSAQISVVNKKLVLAQENCVLDDEKSKKRFFRILNRYHSSRIYIIIDCCEEQVKTVSIPVFNTFIASKVIKDFISSEYISNELVAYNTIDVVKHPIETWRVNISSIQYKEPLTDWLSMIFKTNSELGEVYFLNLEAYNIMHSLRSLAAKKQIKSPPEDSSKIILLNFPLKSSGVRQFAFFDNNLVLERSVDLPGDKSWQYIEGLIDNEIKESLIYLNKYHNSQKQIYTEVLNIVPEILYDSFKAKDYDSDSYLAFTPKELMYYKNYSEFPGNDNSSMYLDSFTAIELANIKKSPAINEKLNRFSDLSTFNKLTFKPLYFILIIFTIYIFHFKFLTLQNNAELSEIDSKYQEELTKFDEYRKQFSNIDNFGEITDIYTLQTILKSKHEPPFSMIKRFLSVKSEQVNISTINWGVKNNLKIETTQAGNNNDNEVAFVDINLRFFASAESYKDLFTEYKEYIDDLEKNFNNYEVIETRLNEKIDAPSGASSIPVKIRIIGPTK
jgi:cell division protein FtsL